MTTNHIYSKTITAEAGARRMEKNDRADAVFCDRRSNNTDKVLNAIAIISEQGLLNIIIVLGLVFHCVGQKVQTIVVNLRMISTS